MRFNFNIKRFIPTFILIFIAFRYSTVFIERVVMQKIYYAVDFQSIFRPIEIQQNYEWVIWIIEVVWSFLFTYIFVKGYENRGIAEGIRFGFIIGFFNPFFWAYKIYTLIRISYDIAFQWFFYGVLQCILLGVIASLIYREFEEDF